MKLLLLLFDLGIELEHALVRQEHGGRNVQVLWQEALVLIHLRVSLVAVGGADGDVEPGLQHGLEDSRDRRAGRPGDERLRIGRLDAFDLRRDADVLGIETLTFNDLHVGILRQLEHFIEAALGVLTGGVGTRHECDLGPVRSTGNSAPALR